jgi:hypothetical protein
MAEMIGQETLDWERYSVVIQKLLLGTLLQDRLKWPVQCLELVQQAVFL